MGAACTARAKPRRTNVGYAVMSAVGSMVGSEVGMSVGTRVIHMVGAKVGSLVTGIGADEGPARQEHGSARCHHGMGPQRGGGSRLGLRALSRVAAAGELLHATAASAAMDALYVPSWQWNSSSMKSLAIGKFSTGSHTPAWSFMT